MRKVIIDLDKIEKIICDSSKESWENDKNLNNTVRKWNVETKDVIEILRNNHEEIHED